MSDKPAPSDAELVQSFSGSSWWCGYLSTQGNQAEVTEAETAREALLKRLADLRDLLAFATGPKS
jgi:hypothetical protein